MIDPKKLNGFSIAPLPHVLGDQPEAGPLFLSGPHESEF
jgi:hypothetical protein